MKKEIYRDYAAEAFRLWARHGCKPYRKILEELREEAGRVAEDGAELLRYTQMVSERAAELQDLQSCDAVFAQLKEQERGYICRAVEQVYMIEPKRELHQGDISARVLCFAREEHTDERNVYRWLYEARRMFAEQRGLRG